MMLFDTLYLIWAVYVYFYFVCHIKFDIDLMCYFFGITPLLLILYIISAGRFLNSLLFFCSILIELNN